jgi:hypothetical protein
VVTSYYLRLNVADEAGVLAKVTIVTHQHRHLLTARSGRGGRGAADRPDHLTHDCVEARMNEAARMQALSTVLSRSASARKSWPDAPAGPRACPRSSLPCRCGLRLKFCRHEGVGVAGVQRSRGVAVFAWGH